MTGQTGQPIKTGQLYSYWWNRRNSLSRSQDTSAPNNWCRSVQTLRHHFFVGAKLSHRHFGLVPNCLKTKGNGQSKTWRDRRHSQKTKYLFLVYPARWKSVCSNCSKCHSDEIRKYVLWEAYKYNHFAVVLARRPIGICIKLTFYAHLAPLHGESAVTCRAYV